MVGYGDGKNNKFLEEQTVISHEHRCVFVHIPKCAGQSIETVFLEDLGLDWSNRSILLLRPNECPDIGPPRLVFPEVFLKWINLV